MEIESENMSPEKYGKGAKDKGPTIGKFAKEIWKNNTIA